MFPSLTDDKYGRMQELINTMKNTEFQESEAPPAPEKQPGPFSALFNYDDEKERMEQTYAKRQAMDQKVARGNAVVDAFRLLTQGLGGAAGATIPKETPNQSVTKAYDDYRNMDTEMRDRLERFRMLDLNNMSRDLQYKQGLEAEQRGRDFSLEQKEGDREFSAEEKEKDRTFRAGQTQAEIDSRGALADQASQNRMAEEKYKAEHGHYSYQNRSNDSKKGYALKGVDITPELQAKMIHALQLKYQEDPMKSRVLKDVDRDESTQTESLHDLFLKDWDYLSEAVPELSGREAKSEILNTPQGDAPQQRDTSAYDQAITEVIQRTDMNYRKKTKFIRDIVMEAYGLDKDKAEQYAKEVLGAK